MSLEVLRESYELDYERVFSEGVSDYGFDEIFMECCIASGYSMDEAVDAALQKFRLYASEEAKICKKLAKETQKAVKAKRYDDALDSAKRRLAHLKNLHKRSNDIDDDEAYIIQTEAIVRTFVVAFITTAVLVKVVNGVIPGSGWLIDYVRKVINQYKVHNFSDTLKGGVGAFIRDIIEPVLSIAGLAKMTSSAAAKHRLSKWEKNRGDDVNREVNAGRPDVTRMSVSRTEAKTRFTKLVKAQEDEIKMLESLKRAAGNKTPKNESVNALQEAKLSSDKRDSLDSDQFGLPDQRKYPLNDKVHVNAAIKMFSHCPEKDRRKLAINILKAMEKFGMPAEIRADSPMVKYVPKKYIVH